jgi:hypothetical protein
VSASLQQLSGGLASVIAGLIVVEEQGRIVHFDTLGYIIVGTVMVTLVMMYFIHRAVPEYIRNRPKKAG